MVWSLRGSKKVKNTLKRNSFYIELVRKRIFKEYKTKTKELIKLKKLQNKEHMITAYQLSVSAWIGGIAYIAQTQDGVLSYTEVERIRIKLERLLNCVTPAKRLKVL
jgi:hypothetical protein